MDSQGIPECETITGSEIRGTDRRTADQATHARKNREEPEDGLMIRILSSQQRKSNFHNGIGSLAAQTQSTVSPST